MLFLFILVLSAKRSALSIRYTTGIPNILNNLLNAKTENEQEILLKSILKEQMPVDTLITLLKGIKFKKPEKTGIIWAENSCSNEDYHQHMLLHIFQVMSFI